MALEVILRHRGGRKLLDVVQGNTGEAILVIQTEGQAHGVFKTASAAAAATTTIIDIEPGTAIILTDLIVNAEKKAGSTFDLEFYDGTNTETIVSPDVVNNPVNMAIAFAGCWLGWSGAELQMTTTGNFNHRVSVGYYKVHSTLTFAEWDGRR